MAWKKKQVCVLERPSQIQDLQQILLKIFPVTCKLMFTNILHLFGRVKGKFALRNGKKPKSKCAKLIDNSHV